MYDWHDKSYIENLYEKANLYLEDNPYLSYGEEDSFHTKAVGVTMENRQSVIARLTEETAIYLEREPFNSYDANAIKIMTENHEHIGYINRKLALVLAPIMDGSQAYDTYITQITGGSDGRNFGVSLLIIKQGFLDEPIDDSVRDTLTKLPEGELWDKICQAILGEYSYHDKQLETLDALAAKKNVLAVFGTGRGKSAIFQSWAAYRALRERLITVIVYPLRALSNDQYKAMQGMYSHLGLRVCKANGSMNTEERTLFFDSLRQGDVDIILSTPEFILHHSNKFKSVKDKIGLFVVDEAHHIGDSHRPAYRRLNEIATLLGQPQVQAVTATADDRVARAIIKMLNIQETVIDPFVRSNLEIVDMRNHNDKERYLLSNVVGRKAIIYAGTRKETVRLAQLIRDTIPGFKYKVGFYHGGMTSKDRTMMEAAFQVRTSSMYYRNQCFWGRDQCHRCVFISDDVLSY